MRRRRFCRRRLLPASLAIAAMAAPAMAAPAAAPTLPPAPAQLPGQAARFDARRYVPAVLRLTFTSQRQGPTASAEQSFIDITLIPPRGAVVGHRVIVASSDFSGLLRRFYGQLSRQESLEVEDPASPARQLDRLLIAPIREQLKAAAVTTLLISADQGLQAIPFAALHDGTSYLGESLAFSLTPSLSLTPLDLPPDRGPGRPLSAGASRFDGLSPLPLVPQELEQMARSFRGQPVSTYLNERFTPQVLLAKAGDAGVNQVHVATHAEFLPGGPARSRVYTGSGAMSLSEFAVLRKRRQSEPLNLFVLSACRTALGDRDSELGFAGLALQAGSRSAVGSLWYVDDVATSAYFVQFYRYLNAGVPKAEAMQLVRTAMAQGRFQLQGDRLSGPDGQPLLAGLTPEQQRRVSAGLRHPFYWAGITLLGTPW